MSFLSLPSEIIDAIIDLSLPLGIEGLSLVSKAIHGRAKSQIERHNVLKRQWRHVHNYGTGRLDNTLGILEAISRDPMIAEYIETLDLWDPRGIEEEDADLLDFRKDPDAMERVKSLVTTSPFLKDTDVDTEAWWTRMMEEEEVRADEDNTQISCTTIALLGLLPNLKSLRLDPGWQNFAPEAPEYHLPLSGLAAIVNRATQAGDSRPRPLGKLKTILPFMSSGYEEKAALQSVQPFLELSSVTELYLVSAVAVDDGYTGYPFTWSTPTIAPFVNRIELVSCCIDSEGIGELVRHTPSLAVFRYSHETKWHGCEHDWNVGLFVEALARYCGNTLLELAITIDELSGDIINGVSSLLSFRRLQRLEVDVQVFCGPPVESGQRLGLDSILPEGEQPWEHGDIPCIGSMLPDTIVEVQINTDFPVPDEQALNSLLKNLRSQRLERLHLMERCVIRQYQAESARVYAERAGATLETFDLDIADPRLRKMMPTWKRDFEERVRRRQS
ncbi:hypothetical protein N0V90_005029 [Kalmusia sp. IMI 367209]|nr:hypothetical protein N0V90_005029 [Kalmusia sp. IMI 367209]